MDSKRKLLLINSVANYGSTGHIVEAIGKRAEKSGLESYLACGERYSLDSSLNRFIISNECQQMIHAAHSFFFDRSGFSIKKNTEKLILWMKELAPDIIHIHNLHGYYLNVSSLFSSLNTMSIPVVWTLHDCWPITGHCVHFQSVGCTNWITGCHHCPQLAQYPRSLFMDQSARNYKQKKALFTGNKNLHLVVVSDWMKRVVSKSFLKDYPISVISNGIDTDVFHRDTSHSAGLRSRYDLDGKVILLGVASTWSKEKGYDEWLALRKALPEKYAIVLIGVNERQQAECADYGIIGLPKTSTVDDLVAWYSTSDLTLSLSLGESFGLTIAESLACGTPVVVYDNTALPELVSDETGMVAGNLDINSVAECVYALASSPKSPDACIKEARKRFRIQDNLSRYMELYNSVLAGS